MNSIQNHEYEFISEFIYKFRSLNSYLTSYILILIYDFTIVFMIMKSYLNSCHEFIQNFTIMNSHATFRDL